MPQLSSVYLRDVIVGVIRAQIPIGLRNLILSSREMCLSFDGFMQNINVRYCHPFLYFTIHSRDLGDLRCGEGNSPRWITPFIRKLAISRALNKDILFFDKLFRFKNLLHLNLANLRLLSSTSGVVVDCLTALASITPRLTIKTKLLDTVQNSRFESLNLKVGDTHNKSFTEEIEEKGSNVLQIITSGNPFTRGSNELARFKDKFQRVQTVYCSSNDSIDTVRTMIHDCLIFFTNIKNVNLHFAFDWHGSFSQLKASYDQLVVNLPKISERVNVNLNITTVAYFRAYNEMRTEVEALFPSADFDITYDLTNPMLPFFSNRQTRLTDTVKFSFNLR